MRGHPLMLEEHVLARNLDELVHTMQSRKKTHLVPFLFQKVISLQEAYDELKKEFDVLKTAKIEPLPDNLPSSLMQTPKLKFKQAAEFKLKSRIMEARDGLIRVLKEILAARQLRDTEAQTSRLLEYRIIKTWDRIKGLRTAQGFSSTPIKLFIKTCVAEKIDYRQEAVKEVFYKKELWELENLESISTRISSNGQLSAQQDDMNDTDALLCKENNNRKIANYIGKSVEHLSAFQDKKVRENATRRLKACYPSQPELEFRMDSSHPITNMTDCPHVCLNCS